MKKFISFLLALVILFSIAAPTVNIAYAVGDQNYTGGDYDLDYLNPTGSYWDETLQGIRISLFDCNTKKVTKTIDYSNHKAETLANYPLSYQDPATGEYISLTANVAKNWYGYVDKLQYMKGKGLTKGHGRYDTHQFRDGSGNILTFPNCIVNEKSNYAAVKKFFTDNGIARGLAKDFGVNFDILATTDRYKLILEPVVYFCWCNQWYAMTATEAAVYDKTYGPMNAVTVDGKSYRRMMKLTRGMVQLCMYLEKDDTVVGIAAYHGTQSEQEPTISIPKLGVGIISFAELLQASDKAKFKLTIIKEDSVTGARLAGAKFNIYDPLLKKTFKVTTDSNGEASVYCAIPDGGNLFVYPKIEVTETKAPEGYVSKYLYTRPIDAWYFSIYMNGSKYTLRVKNDPIEDQEDEPIDGDNIVWAYQLTESFTNDTNFNSRPSWRGAPTLHSCSKGYTSYSGTTDYYPYIPDDAYDISVKANDIYEDVPDGNGGTIEVYSHTEYDYSYKISHDSSCLVGIIWNGQPGGNGSTEVEIPASTYIAGSVFSDNSNMNEYKILHNGSNYMLQFEGFGGPRGITYSIPRYQDIFAELADTLKTWISHRNGGLTRQAQELPLASYMSSQNAAYKNFYSRYTGNTATERASNSSNPAFYGSTNNINTHTTHGGNLRRWYTGYYCNDGHSDGDPVVYDELHTGTTTSNPRQTYRYAVEGSYKAQARSKDTSKTEVKEIFKNTGHTKKVYMMPSNQYSFYPTYEMTYTDTLGSHNTDTAYMLSAGRRTFRATDAISIETSGGETEVWAPWSRDWVDKYADESVYNYYEPERGYSVIKAGMVVKAVTSSPATVTLRAAFNVQDPAYAPEELRETVKAQNDAKAREMEQALKDVVADLQQRTAETYGYYSNLWEATSENLSTLSGGALDPQMPSWAYSESPKTRLNIAEHQAPSVQWHYTAYRGVGGTQRGTLNTLTINGHKYNNAARVSAMDTYMGTVDTVTALLDTARGTAGKQNVRAAARSSTTDGAYTNWYEEYYEGIRVCEITAKVELGAGQINTLYTQVHSQLSDDVTPMNEQAQNLLSYGYNNEPLFEDGMFGIGLCAVTDTVTVGSNSFERAFCYFPPFHFGVRGHLYDLAQRGFAHTIRL